MYLLLRLRLWPHDSQANFAVLIHGPGPLGFVRPSDRAGRQGAESARVCWAAMVSEMPGNEPRQDAAPTDTEILAVWADTHFATYDEDPKAVVKFAQALIERYGQAVLQSSEIQALRDDAARYRAIVDGICLGSIDVGEAYLTLKTVGSYSTDDEFDASIDAIRKDQP